MERDSFRCERGEPPHKIVAIGAVEEDRAAFDAAADDVVQDPGGVESCGSGHKRKNSKSGFGSKAT